jgi:hypothetical protein
MVPESTQLQSSQTWSLLKIQQLLNYPPVLRTWALGQQQLQRRLLLRGDYKTASAFVECYGDSVTQLHIMGPGAGVPPLPKTSSIDASRTTRCRVRCRSPLGTCGRCGRWRSRATTSPDLSALTNLQVVDLANKSLGPAFPRLGRKVASVVPV